MKLNAMETIQNGVQLGLKSFPALVVNGLLAGITFIVPYINVGTYIGMYTIPAKMARDESLSMTEVLNPGNRKYFGEFFLCLGLMFMGILPAAIFLYFPAVVLGLSWMLAPLLVVDKNMQPLDAMRKSNELTYGNKWPIFFALLGTEIVIAIAFNLLRWLGGLIDPIVGLLLGLIVIILAMPIILGVIAEIYKKLTANS